MDMLVTNAGNMRGAAFAERYAFTSDGKRLYYRDYNSGAPGMPVLCLSGLTRNSHDYHPLACHLAALGRRVIAPDYRGRGQSDYDANWRNYRPLRLLRDINGLVHDLHLRHAAVIGTSLGGLLAMGLAALRPGFVTAAVINDIGPDLTTDGIPRICSYVGHDHPQKDWQGAVAHLKQTFPHIGIADEDEWRFMAEGTFRWKEDGMLHVDWDTAIARSLAGGAKSPLPLWLVFRALLRIPALVVRGGKSDVLSEATFNHMAELKPGLMRVTIPNAGHTPTLNEPEARAAIDSLLEQAR